MQIPIPNFAFCTVKSLSVTQRSDSQKKGLKNRFCLYISFCFVSFCFVFEKP